MMRGLSGVHKLSSICMICHKALVRVKIMAAVMLLFYASGLAITGYLYYCLLKSQARSVNRMIIAFHLLLNICNILSHAALEISKHDTVIKLSTHFSFQTVYCLVAIEFSSFLGRPAQQSLNSFMSIALLTFISTAVSMGFGTARYQVCGIGTDNCFDVRSNTTFDASQDSAVLRSYFSNFLVPTSIILFTGLFTAFSKCMQMKNSNRTSSWAGRIARVCASCAVSLFLLYGMLITEVFLYSIEGRQTTAPSEHLCRVMCLYNELYFLLSMFPVGYVVYFVKAENEAILKEQTSA